MNIRHVTREFLVLVVSFPSLPDLKVSLRGGPPFCVDT